jgi:hypothetical protein
MHQKYILVGRMAEAVRVPSKSEALSSNPRATKKNKQIKIKCQKLRKF